MQYTDEDGVTWYWCNTCGFWFPASEARDHRGHNYVNRDR